MPDPERNGAQPELTGPDRDAELLAQFRRGDREAFTFLYRIHSPAVFRFALHMSGDATKATETTQDVFVWLIHHPGRFDASRGRLGAFLTGVARRFLLRQWNRERRWTPLEEAAFLCAPRAREVHSDPRVEQLRCLIASLPDRYREVVVLCDLEGHSYEEAASILECSLGTVRSRLHRARELLARKLRPEKRTLECGV